MAEQVLEPALALGSLMQAEYDLLRVCEPLPEIGTDQLEIAMAGEADRFLERLRVEASEYLGRTAKRLNARGAKVHAHVIVGNHTASTILDMAQKLVINLIAMETHGHGGLTRLRLGSVADKVLRGASIPPVPVMLHRSAAT